MRGIKGPPPKKRWTMDLAENNTKLWSILWSVWYPDFDTKSQDYLLPRKVKVLNIGDVHARWIQSFLWSVDPLLLWFHHRHVDVDLPSFLAELRYNLHPKPCFPGLFLLQMVWRKKTGQSSFWIHKSTVQKWWYIIYYPCPLPEFFRQ